MHTHPRMLLVNALKSCILVLLLFLTLPAKAQINIAEWKNYGQLAEQGAVCAGFAAIMETQDVISQDIGRLWSERRKYSGALIRNAGRLETGTSPTASEIDHTISVYREWIFANLVQTEEEVALGTENDLFSTGQSQIRALLKTNCKSVYDKADSAIFQRFPELAYLSQSQFQQLSQSDIGISDKNAQKLEELLIANLELNEKLQNAQKTIDEFRKRIGVPVNIEVPTSRNALQQSIASKNAVQQSIDSEVANQSSEKAEDERLDSEEPNQELEKRATPVQNKSQTEDEVFTAVASNSAPKVEPVVKPHVEMEKESKNTVNQLPTANQLPIVTKSKSEDLFIIQIASFKSRKRADTMIRKLKDEKAELFSAAILGIQLHSLPSGSSLYRVITSPISRNNATSLCEVLWAERIGCLIKANS